MEGKPKRFVQENGLQENNNSQQLTQSLRLSTLVAQAQTYGIQHKPTLPHVFSLQVFSSETPHHNTVPRHYKMPALKHELSRSASCGRLTVVSLHRMSPGKSPCYACRARARCMETHAQAMKLRLVRAPQSASLRAEAGISRRCLLGLSA